MSSMSDLISFFFNSNEYQIFKKIIALEYEFPSGFPEVPKDLVQSLLVSNVFVTTLTLYDVISKVYLRITV